MARQAEIEIVLSDGRKAGNTLKDLQSQANHLNNQIKKLEIGSAEWEKKTKDYQKITGRLKDVRNEVRGVSTEAAGMLSSFSKFLPFGGHIQQLTGAFGGLRQGVGGVTSGFKTLRGAIMATGIGALLLAIGSLVSMFKSSEEGQDKWNKIMKVTGVIVGNLSDILANLGETIYDAVVNPVAAAQKAWEGLKKFFSDPIGTIKDGFDAAKEAATGFFEETKKEISQAQAVADLEAETNRLERRLLVERKQIEAEIAELRLKSRQEDEFTAKQRLQFLDDANRLQEELLSKDTEVAANRYEIIKQTNQFSKSTKENLDAEAQAQAELAQVEVTRYNQARQIERERQRIRKEIERDDNAESARRKKEEEEFLKQLETEEKAEIEAQKKKFEEINKLRQQNFEDQKTISEINNEEQKIAIDEAFADRLLSEEERQDALYELEANRLQSQLELIKAYYGESSNEAKKATNELAAFMTQKRVEDVAQTAEAEGEKGGIITDTAQRSLATFSSVFGGMKGLYDEAGKEYKDFAIIQSQIDTINAALAAYRSTAAIPIFGPGLAPIAAAAAFTFGQLQQQKIQSVKKAEFGALLRGSRHSAGGIMVNAEDGEIILNRNVSQDPIGLQMASDLNAMYGGIRFMEAGGPVNPLSAQQIAAQAPAVSGGSNMQSNNNFQNTVIAYMQKIDRYITSIRVINNVQDTREGLKVINNLEQDAGF
jgi:hypothetical protein